MESIAIRRTAILRLTGLGAVCALALGYVSPAFAAGNPVGAVYTQTNAASGNMIVSFDRHANGALTYAGMTATGGIGTGGGLGNQGAVAISRDSKRLLAVNAGSNDISVFAIRQNGLALTDREPSGGVRPISVTVSGSLVYVLNAGAPNNISGFRLSPRGHLTPIPDSTRPLSAADTGPAQVELSRDGRLLVVTEKATNLVLTYTLDSNGVAHGPVFHASAGATPFGFAFGQRNQIFVSEAFGGAADASALSSYSVDRRGGLNWITPSALTTETAACWVAVTGNGKFAYAANAGSGSISGYAVGVDGSVSLLNADGVTGSTGAGSAPIDLAVSRNGQYLYVALRGLGRIGAFKIEGDGSLTAIDASDSILPPTITGLAAR